MKILTLLPFTYDWIIRRQLNGFSSVLDLGCSDGELMIKINSDKKYKVVGVDIFKPDLDKAKLTGVYKQLIKGDVRKLKVKKKFDVVMSSQVIEHLPKTDGVKLIKQMESCAKKRVIIATPVGFLPYNPIQGDESGNLFQEHKSGWEVEEFENLGYKIYGQGTRLFYKENGILRNVPKKLHTLFFFLSYLFGPLFKE